MPFDDLLSGQVHFEIYFPVSRPGRQQGGSICFRVQEHVLQGRHAPAAMVHVGHPVVVWAPERREAALRMLGEEGLGNHARGLSPKAEQGGLDGILVPASHPFFDAAMEGSAGQFEVRLFEREQAIWEDGVQFRVLYVGTYPEVSTGGDAGLTAHAFHRQCRDLAGESPAGIEEACRECITEILQYPMYVMLQTCDLRCRIGCSVLIGFQ